MQYKIHVENHLPALPALTEAFLNADPSSLVDLDPAGGVVRVSTLLRDAEIISACAQINWPVEMRQIELVPSECCGGCGG